MPRPCLSLEQLKGDSAEYCCPSKGGKADTPIRGNQSVAQGNVSVIPAQAGFRGSQGGFSGKARIPAFAGSSTALEREPNPPMPLPPGAGPAPASHHLPGAVLRAAATASCRRAGWIGLCSRAHWAPAASRRRSAEMSPPAPFPCPHVRPGPRPERDGRRDSSCRRRNCRAPGRRCARRSRATLR